MSGAAASVTERIISQEISEKGSFPDIGNYPHGVRVRSIRDIAGGIINISFFDTKIGQRACIDGANDI